jgi:hypothetical protein
MEVTIQDVIDDYEIEAPERTVKKEILSVINDVLNTDLSLESITYQKGTVWIDVDPVTRSQIHIKKNLIKKKISQEIESRSISDIH